MKRLLQKVSILQNCQIEDYSDGEEILSQFNLNPKGKCEESRPSVVSHVTDVKSEHIVLVLMDANMNSVGGVKATQLLRQNNVSVPVVIVSGSVMAFELDVYRSAGAQGVLGKPFSLKALQDTVCTILNNVDAQTSFHVFPPSRSHKGSLLPPVSSEGHTEKSISPLSSSKRLIVEHV